MINVFFKTYGCQANVADSLALKRYLQAIGCNVVESEFDADIILINSCAIREKAEQKLFSYIGECASYKKLKHHLKIGVIGCVASYRKNEIFERFAYVDFVFSARDDLIFFKAYLTDLVVSLETQKQLYDGLDSYQRVRPRDKDIIDIVKKRNLKVVSFNKKLKILKANSIFFNRSLINIMRGCNNYCSYCIVPFTRGREQSFAMSKILESVRQDLHFGAKEITLIGQNVNSYKDPETGSNFAQLLENVAKIDGEFWIRFISPHPKDMTIDVIDTIAKYNNKLCAFIHLPLQSGSNKILKLMNRMYTVEKYMKQIGWIREKLPHAMISTDFIVGFPGETEQDYQATRKVMEDVRYNLIYSFIYSPRKYTKAAQMEDLCAIQEKKRRLFELQKRQREIGISCNQRLVGQTVRVLVEQQISDQKFLAKTEGNIRVFVLSENFLINKFVSVVIQRAGLDHVEGSIAN